MNWSTNCQLNLHHTCDGYIDEQLPDTNWDRVPCQCRCHTKDRVPDLVAA